MQESDAMHGMAPITLSSMKYCIGYVLHGVQHQLSRGLPNRQLIYRFSTLQKASGPGRDNLATFFGPMITFGTWKTHCRAPTKSACLVTKHPFTRRQVDDITPKTLSSLHFFPRQAETFLKKNLGCIHALFIFSNHYIQINQNYVNKIKSIRGILSIININRRIPRKSAVCS